jgi:hypothetical protein
MRNFILLLIPFFFFIYLIKENEIEKGRKENRQTVCNCGGRIIYSDDLKKLDAKPELAKLCPAKGREIWSR